MHDYTGEKVAANYWRGAEALGGKLRFDETGMTFDSHRFNIQTGSTRIEYRDIAGLTTYRTFGLVNNGLTVRTKDGTAHRFVLNRRGRVIEFLTSRITSG